MRIVYFLIVLYTVVLFPNLYAQTVEESNTTITLDMQPILQLNVNGPQSLSFIFDELNQYQTGIIYYGATILTINATVNWDLYAVGYSGAGPVWEQVAKYGSGADVNAEDVLSLHALELHQNKVNPSASGAVPFFNADYSAPFTSDITVGQNSIYASDSPYIKPLSIDKYIAGHNSTSDFVTGGSYLMGSIFSDSYHYIIDYRIKPGLPATFPNSGTNSIPGVPDGITTSGHYLQPGIYTCNVKFVITENN